LIIINVRNIYFKKLTLQNIHQTMRNILYYIFGVFVLSACTPNQDADGDLLNGIDYDWTNNGGGNGGPTPTKLLKKVTIDDAGDIVTYTYTYNTDKKLTGITTDDNSLKISITYLASGNIEKIVRTENNMGTVSTEEIVPVYAGGKIDKTNVTHTENGKSIKSIGTITYSSNGWPSAIKEDIYDESNTKIAANFASTLTYSGNNITRWNFKSSFATGLPVPVFDFLQEMELTANLSEYDDKINPYNLLPKDYLIATVHAEADASSITGFAKNNARKIGITVVFAGTPLSDSQAVVYLYDKDGYPTTATSTDIVTKFEYQ